MPNDMINRNDENQMQAPGQVSDDFQREVLENIRAGRSHRSEWRVMAREAYDFYAGIQWDETDSQKLTSEGRPAVVFNRTVRTINSVSGLEIQNRQEVKYYPRNVDLNNQPTNDAGYSDMLNGASKWVRETGDFEDEESEAFIDNLICGEGWTEMRMDYEINPEGMIVKDRIDPLEMLVDPDSIKRNYADAKWVARIKDFSRQEIKQLFPEYQGNGGTFWNDIDTSPHNAQDAWMYKNDQSDKLSQPGKISVVHYQYYRVENYYSIYTPDGSIIELSEYKYNIARPFIEMQSIKKVKMKRRRYRQCFVIGNEIFDDEDLGCNHFNFQSNTGIRDRNRKFWFGLIELMKDPQRWANKWLSQIQYILNTSSKNALFVEEGAVVDRRSLEDDIAQPGAIIDLSPGGLGRIQEMEKASYPEGIDRLLQYAIGAVNDIPGVNLELIGMANRDQPIGLEQSRKQAGMTVLALFFDSLRRYRKTDGRVLAYFIREYISDGRLVRILGKDGAKYVPLIKDQLAFEYDIVVDDSPTSPNSKERTFAIMNQIAPLIMQAGIPMPPEILDYAPLPEDFVQKWKQLIQQSNQPDPMADQVKQIQYLMMQLELAQKEADVQKTGSETVKNFAQAEKDKSVGQEQAALAMQKFGVLQNDQSMKANNMMIDQTRKNTQMYLEHFRKMLEIQLEDKLKKNKMGAYPSLNRIQ